MQKKYSIGIDIGGTHTVGGIVDSEGKILGRVKTSTLAHDSFDDFADELAEKLREMVKKSGMEGEIAGIGVGAPCVDSTTGEINGAVDLPWPSPIPLVKALEQRMNLPVWAANDANAAVMGEWRYGSAKGEEHFIMLTLGSGIGAGIIADGKLLEGYRGMGGELGHTIIRRDGRECACGRKGCLETYCSARGIVRTALQMLDESERDSKLREIPRAELNGKDIYDAAMAGDLLAKEIFEYTGEILGEACADFCALTSPRKIVFFGGLAQAGELLLEPARRAMDKHILHIYRGQVELCCSSLPDADAAVLGAAALVEA